MHPLRGTSSAGDVGWKGVPKVENNYKLKIISWEETRMSYEETRDVHKEYF